MAAEIARTDKSDRTLVVQSYRTEAVPGWIGTALESVRDWAQGRGMHYRFLDDQFFERAPEWIRQRFATHLYVIVDVARLYLLADGLREGFERVIWLDADVLVFDAQRFAPGTISGAAFCREHMLSAMPDGSVRVEPPGINNAVMVFDAGNPVLPFYIHACEAILRQPSAAAGLARTALGPMLLQRLGAVLPLECLEQVGLFTPGLMHELAMGGTRMAELYAGQSRTALAAANLCHFARHKLDERGRQVMDAQYERAVRVLLDSRGAVVNRFRKQD